MAIDRSAGHSETAADCDTRVLQLFDAHHERLYRLARRLTSSQDDARDLVQETFVRIAGTSDRVPHGPSPEEAWLVRVLINVCRDQWRVRAARRHLEARYGSSAWATSARSPEAAFVARATVWRALETLPPRRRAVVVLHELDGLAAGEIARLLGISAVTVRWHLSRGRHELAAAISAQEKDT